MPLLSLPAGCKSTNRNAAALHPKLATMHTRLVLHAIALRTSKSTSIWTSAHRQQRQRRLLCVHAGLNTPDPYALLQVPRGASRKEIRAAYIEQIRILHPDVSDREDATQVAMQLNAAYAALMTSPEVACVCINVTHVFACTLLHAPCLVCLVCLVCT